MKPAILFFIQPGAGLTGKPDLPIVITRLDRVIHSGLPCITIYPSSHPPIYSSTHKLIHRSLELFSIGHASPRQKETNPIGPEVVKNAM